MFRKTTSPQKDKEWEKTQEIQKSVALKQLQLFQLYVEKTLLFFKKLQKNEANYFSFNEDLQKKCDDFLLTLKISQLYQLFNSAIQKDNFKEFDSAFLKAALEESLSANTLLDSFAALVSIAPAHQFPPTPTKTSTSFFATAPSLPRKMSNPITIRPRSSTPSPN